MKDERSYSARRMLINLSLFLKQLLFGIEKRLSYNNAIIMSGSAN
jgi:hypothetical protein